MNSVGSGFYLGFVCDRVLTKNARALTKKINRLGLHRQGKCHLAKSTNQSKASRPSTSRHSVTFATWRKKMQKQKRAEKLKKLKKDMLW